MALTERIQVVVSPEEMKAVKKLADHEGISCSYLLRSLWRAAVKTDEMQTRLKAAEEGAERKNMETVTRVLAGLDEERRLEIAMLLAK